MVAKIKRVAIGGGSDIALACDVTFTEDSARIGYPPSNAFNGACYAIFSIFPLTVNTIKKWIWRNLFVAFFVMRSCMGLPYNSTLVLPSWNGTC